MPAGSAPDLHRLFIAALVAGGLATACKQTHLVLGPVTDGGPTGTGGTSGAGGRGGAGGGGAPLGPVTTVSTSYFHTCAISRGALFCWGKNDDGQLGLGDTAPHRTPMRVGNDADWADVQVAEVSSLGRKSDGTIWSFGGNDRGQLGQGDLMARNKPTPIGNDADWIAIATRFDHACALKVDGTVWCWGAGNEGQLGQNEPGRDGLDRTEPTKITTLNDVAMVDTGQGHTCAILRNRTLWCWGRNTSSILSQGEGTPERIKHPVQVEQAADWQRIRAGQSGSCGLRGGRVYCWGKVNDHSQPGSPEDTDVPVPTDIGGPKGAIDLTFNTFGGCLFDAQGAGACWGRNQEGQLGLGDAEVRNDVVALPIGGWTWLSAGWFSTCGVNDGQVWCTGENKDGQIGLGSVSRVSSFVKVQLEP